jgi:hypothetical protein
MAQLQTTGVTGSLWSTQNNFVRVGTAYFSSGGNFAHIGQGSYYNGTAWQGAGPYLQLTATALSFVTNITTFPVLFSTSAATTTIASTTTTYTTTGGNSTTNSTVGIGAAAGTAAGDGKLYINAGDAAGTVKPFLEVTNCLGNGSTSTATFSVFKGYLGIKIGANVGPATSVATGTYYLRLWSNA